MVRGDELPMFGSRDLNSIGLFGYESLLLSNVGGEGCHSKSF